MYIPARDWAYTPREGKFTMNRLAPVFRFREAMSWDFKARMDWAVKGVEEANHNPVIRIMNQESIEPLFMEATAGGIISLDATDSYDPDGDALTCYWWIYHEAGIYSGLSDLKAPLPDENNPEFEFHIPDDAQTGDIFHLILEITDNGDPALKSYRRVVVQVCNNGPCNTISNITTERKITFSAYPNPAGDRLYVKTEPSGRLVITDNIGCQQYAQKISEANTTIDIRSLINGMYILSYVSDNGEIESLKFFKQK